MDFTLKTYNKLLKSLIDQGFLFQTLSDSLTQRGGRTIILRQDVDSLPANSLKFARIQSETGIKGTYYFRIVPESFDEKIILEIYKLGHEVGYHYEDVSLAAVGRRASGIGRQAGIRQKTKVKRQKDGGNNNITSQQHNAITKKEVCIKKYEEEEYERYLASLAIVSFKENLAKLRELVPVKTVCMHGSPMSRWDSRVLWKYYDYRDFGIIGEPYFDVDFDEVLYLTDTGRRWDGDSFNVRDKAQGSGLTRSGATKFRVSGRTQGKSNRLPVTDYRLPFPSFHSTFDIIHAAEAGKLPDKIIMTFHPQRWTDKPLPWVKELVWQNVKNVGKFFVVKLSNR